MEGLSAGTAFVDLQPRIGAGFQGAIGGKLAGILGPVGAAAGAVLGVGLAAGIGGALALKGIGEQFDDAFDTIRVGTGAVGEDLAGLQQEFKDVFASVPTDSGLAAQAITELNQRLDLTGDVLQERATQFLELSRITGTDLTSNIANVTRVFGDWGIAVDDQGPRLDELFRASQATGIGVDTLAGQMVKFGAPLRQLGFDFTTTAALLGKFEAEGVNAELVMGSLRIALGKMARAGEPAEETLARVTDEIKNAGSVSEANAIALELFGARAGPDMAAAIREGRFELGELFDTVANGTDTVTGAAAETEDFAEKWLKFKNRVLVALEPAATKFLGVLGTLVDTIGPKLEPLIGTIANVVGTVVGFFTNTGDAVGGFAGKTEGIAGTIGSVVGAIGTIFQTQFAIIKDVIATVVGFFQENSDTIGSIVNTIGEIIGGLAGVIKFVFGQIAAFWEQWGGTITALLGNAFRTIAGIVDGALKVIKGIIDVVLGILTGDWSRAWEGIKSIVGGVWTAIKAVITGVIGQVMTVFGGFLRNLATSVSTGLSNVVGFFRELPGKIFAFLKDLPGRMLQLGLDLAAGLLGGLADLPGKLFASLKGAIGGAIDKVQSFFGIGSPSKVMADVIGSPLGQGIAAGIIATKGDQANAFTDVIGAGAAAGRRAAITQLGNLNGQTFVPSFRRNPGGPGPEVEGAGVSIVLEEGAVTVVNPKPEPASVTVPREIRRVAATFGRG